MRLDCSCGGSRCCCCREEAVLAGGRVQQGRAGAGDLRRSEGAGCSSSRAGCTSEQRDRLLPCVSRQVAQQRRPTACRCLRCSHHVPLLQLQRGRALANTECESVDLGCEFGRLSKALGIFTNISSLQLLPLHLLRGSIEKGVPFDSINRVNNNNNNNNNQTDEVPLMLSHLLEALLVLQTVQLVPVQRVKVLQTVFFNNKDFFKH